MSMNATFVQVEEAELTKLLADPVLAERLFQDGSAMPPQFANMAKAMQGRVRAGGPQIFAAALSRLDPRLRQQLEERMGRTTAAMAAGEGGDDLLKLMQERSARAAGLAPASAHTTLSLDKDWHGVHYLLCGEKEPGQSLLSKAVMGGGVLGEDDEGFSGYGPARYFTPQRVNELSQALSRAEVESEAAARFDAARMNKLEIYPGWRSSDAEPLMDAFRRLRGFYTDAAAKDRGIVTCLV